MELGKGMIAHTDAIASQTNRGYDANLIYTSDVKQSQHECQKMRRVARKGKTVCSQTKG